MIETSQLAKRWSELCKRLGVEKGVSGFFADLVARYTEPERAYHNLAHVVHCLAEFDASRHLAVQPKAVELAIWYHDAVYDPHGKNNEAASAALAAERIEAASLPGEFAATVARLIQATDHKAPPTDPDARLLVDIDLAILGQRDADFDDYERRIRQEFDWVPEPEFIVGRAAVLRSFIDRPTVYSTPFFREKYEAAARANLARSLSAILALRQS